MQFAIIACCALTIQFPHWIKWWIDSATNLISDVRSLMPITRIGSLRRLISVVILCLLVSTLNYGLWNEQVSFHLLNEHFRQVECLVFVFFFGWEVVSNFSLSNFLLHCYSKSPKWLSVYISTQSVYQLMRHRFIVLSFSLKDEKKSSTIFWQSFSMEIFRFFFFLLKIKRKFIFIAPISLLSHLRFCRIQKINCFMDVFLFSFFISIGFSFGRFYGNCWFCSISISF